MKKYIILGFVAMLFSCLKISAQVNEVKLVASGEGMTETEAVHNAFYAVTNGVTFARIYPFYGKGVKFLTIL